LQIPSGQTDVQVRGSVTAENPVRYLINVRDRQIFAVELFPINPDGDDIVFTVYSPNGQIIPGARNVVFWNSRVSQGGDYLIEVSAPNTRPYELSINIRD
jgi:hypothetical protein